MVNGNSLVCSMITVKLQLQQEEEEEETITIKKNQESRQEDLIMNIHWWISTDLNFLR